jgi:hypothetical protein
MNTLRLVALALPLAALIASPTAAEVRLLTLGITMNCPYGLAG